MEKVYRYYLINREPFIGTHPAGSIASETWYPRHEAPGIPDRMFHGFVEYDRPLEFYMVWKYELYPEDEEEQELYTAWREENNR